MKHTLVAYVEDKPGVLNRVVSLFRRRAFNIDSLTVGRTETEGVSRMTMVVDTDELGIARVEANLYKLVNVLRVDDVTHRKPIMRDLALVKVNTSGTNRAEVLLLCQAYEGKLVDITSTSVVIEVTGPPEKIDSFISLMEPFGIIESVQTGVVAMARGAEAVTVNPPLVEAVAETNGQPSCDGGLMLSHSV
ncbi:MAG TPA: acetolactate synthase small subunit [Gemmatales bacterium]|nr:acetolactate synthase small subunit [Gemmatales bacterium]